MRDPGLAGSFVPQLSQGSGAEYTATLYSTRGVVADTRRTAGFFCKNGRPVWSELLGVHATRERPEEVLVFACGPMQMVDDCAREAVTLGFTFQEETFFL